MMDLYYETGNYYTGHFESGFDSDDSADTLEGVGNSETNGTVVHSPIHTSTHQESKDLLRRVYQNFAKKKSILDSKNRLSIDAKKRGKGEEGEMDGDEISESLMKRRKRGSSLSGADPDKTIVSIKVYGREEEKMKLREARELLLTFNSSDLYQMCMDYENIDDICDSKFWFAVAMGDHRDLVQLDVLYNESVFKLNKDEGYDNEVEKRSHDKYKLMNYAVFGHIETLRDSCAHARSISLDMNGRDMSSEKSEYLAMFRSLKTKAALIVFENMGEWNTRREDNAFKELFVDYNTTRESDIKVWARSYEEGCVQCQMSRYASVSDSKKLTKLEEETGNIYRIHNTWKSDTSLDDLMQRLKNTHGMDISMEFVTEEEEDRKVITSIGSPVAHFAPNSKLIAEHVKRRLDKDREKDNEKAVVLLRVREDLYTSTHALPEKDVGVRCGSVTYRVYYYKKHKMDDRMKVDSVHSLVIGIEYVKLDHNMMIKYHESTYDGSSRRKIQYGM